MTPHITITSKEDTIFVHERLSYRRTTGSGEEEEENFVNNLTRANRMHCQQTVKTWPHARARSRREEKKINVGEGSRLSHSTSERGSNSDTRVLSTTGSSRVQGTVGGAQQLLNYRDLVQYRLNTTTFFV
ncbi:hypothetical protein RRG08_020829 [Elysia crispata]|uniref:Uncharacterized protein n=1 Tax=Elysia crispata TaxID=231223 RepID=A0AAE0XV89_9GAST|nr:hypothetical protein RRG08_020829 [Elysia crispata]